MYRLCLTFYTTYIKWFYRFSMVQQPEFAIWTAFSFCKFWNVFESVKKERERDVLPVGTPRKPTASRIAPVLLCVLLYVSFLYLQCGLQYNLKTAILQTCSRLFVQMFSSKYSLVMKILGTREKKKSLVCTGK